MKFVQRNLVLITISSGCLLLAYCSSGGADKPAVATSDTVKAWEAIYVDSTINNYIYKMNDPGIKIVTDEECGKTKQNIKDYEKEIYKFMVSDIKKIEGDVNADNTTDYLVSYTGDNCWEGIGGNNYLSNFFFMTSENGQLKVNKPLTLQLKQIFFDTLSKYCPDKKATAQEASFINGIEFKSINDNFATGKFSIFWCGESPYLNGDFKWDIKNNSINFEKVERQEAEEQQPPAKVDPKKMDEYLKALDINNRK